MITGTSFNAGSALSWRNTSNPLNLALSVEKDQVGGSRIEGKSQRQEHDGTR